MGIIMAMAGISYSNLYEPDYKGHSFKEKEARSDVKIVVEKLQNIWLIRKKLSDNARERHKDFYQVQKSIYYDTDGINEQQTETVRMCPDCMGYHTIDSLASLYSGDENHVYCISIPLRACLRCQNDAWNLYEDRKAKGTGHQALYMQDKAQDRFLRYSWREGREHSFE